MSIVLVGSSSGSITLQEPAVAGTTTLNLPATSGTVLVGGTQNIPKSALPTGSVLQVVNGFTSTAVTTTVNQTYIDTGITATITPLFASSRIMVLVNLCGMHRTGGNSWNRMGIRMLRGATIIGTEALAQSWPNTALEFRNGGLMYSKLDSPATTSATTYKVQFQGEVLSDNTGLTVQRDGNSGESQIFLMEIAS